MEGRSNVLGKVIIPKIHFTIKYIMSELEEKEREENFRLKRFKQLKTKRQDKEVHICRCCFSTFAAGEIMDGDMCALCKKNVRAKVKAERRVPYVQCIKDDRLQLDRACHLDSARIHLLNARDNTKHFTYEETVQIISPLDINEQRPLLSDGLQDKQADGLILKYPEDNLPFVCSETQKTHMYSYILSVLNSVYDEEEGVTPVKSSLHLRKLLRMPANLRYPYEGIDYLPRILRMPKNMIPAYIETCTKCASAHAKNIKMPPNLRSHSIPCVECKSLLNPNVDKSPCEMKNCEKCSSMIHMPLDLPILSCPKCSSNSNLTMPLDISIHISPCQSVYKSCKKLSPVMSFLSSTASYSAYLPYAVPRETLVCHSWTPKIKKILGMSVQRKTTNDHQNTSSCSCLPNTRSLHPENEALNIYIRRLCQPQDNEHFIRMPLNLVLEDQPKDTVPAYIEIYTKSQPQDHTKNIKMPSDLRSYSIPCVECKSLLNQNVDKSPCEIKNCEKCRSMIHMPLDLPILSCSKCLVKSHLTMPLDIPIDLSFCQSEHKTENEALNIYIRRLCQPQDNEHFIRMPLNLVLEDQPKDTVPAYVEIYTKSQPQDHAKNIKMPSDLRSYSIPCVECKSLLNRNVDKSPCEMKNCEKCRSMIYMPLDLPILSCSKCLVKSHLTMPLDIPIDLSFCQSESCKNLSPVMSFLKKRTPQSSYTQETLVCHSWTPKIKKILGMSAQRETTNDHQNMSSCSCLPNTRSLHPENEALNIYIRRLCQPQDNENFIRMPLNLVLEDQPKDTVPAYKEIYTKFASQPQDHVKNIKMPSDLRSYSIPCVECKSLLNRNVDKSPCEMKYCEKCRSMIHMPLDLPILSCSKCVVKTHVTMPLDIPIDLSSCQSESCKNLSPVMSFLKKRTPQSSYTRETLVCHSWKPNIKKLLHMPRNMSQDSTQSQSTNVPPNMTRCSCQPNTHSHEALHMYIQRLCQPQRNEDFIRMPLNLAIENQPSPQSGTVYITKNTSSCSPCIITSSDQEKLFHDCKIDINHSCTSTCSLYLNNSDYEKIVKVETKKKRRPDGKFREEKIVTEKYVVKTLVKPPDTCSCSRSDEFEDVLLGVWSCDHHKKAEEKIDKPKTDEYEPCLDCNSNKIVGEKYDPNEINNRDNIKPQSICRCNEEKSNEAKIKCKCYNAAISENDDNEGICTLKRLPDLVCCKNDECLTQNVLKLLTPCHIANQKVTSKNNTTTPCHSIIIKSADNETIVCTRSNSYHHKKSEEKNDNFKTDEYEIDTTPKPCLDCISNKKVVGEKYDRNEINNRDNIKPQGICRCNEEKSNEAKIKCKCYNAAISENDDNEGICTIKRLPDLVCCKNDECLTQNLLKLLTPCQFANQKVTSKNNATKPCHSIVIKSADNETIVCTRSNSKEHSKNGLDTSTPQKEVDILPPGCKFFKSKDTSLGLTCASPISSLDQKIITSLSMKWNDESSSAKVSAQLNQESTITKIVKSYLNKNNHKSTSCTDLQIIKECLKKSEELIKPYVTPDLCDKKKCLMKNCPFHSHIITTSSSSKQGRKSLDNQSQKFCSEQPGSIHSVTPNNTEVNITETDTSQKVEFENEYLKIKEEVDRVIKLSSIKDTQAYYKTQGKEEASKTCCPIPSRLGMPITPTPIISIPKSPLASKIYPSKYNDDDIKTKEKGTQMKVPICREVSLCDTCSKTSFLSCHSAKSINTQSHDHHDHTKGKSCDVCSKKSTSLSSHSSKHHHSHHHDHHRDHHHDRHHDTHHGHHHDSHQKKEKNVIKIKVKESKTPMTENDDFYIEGEMEDGSDVVIIRRSKSNISKNTRPDEMQGEICKNCLAILRGDKPFRTPNCNKNHQQIKKCKYCDLLADYSVSGDPSINVSSVGSGSHCCKTTNFSGKSSYISSVTAPGEELCIKFSMSPSQSNKTRFAPCSTTPSREELKTCEQASRIRGYASECTIHKPLKSCGTPIPRPSKSVCIVCPRTSDACTSTKVASRYDVRSICDEPRSRRKSRCTPKASAARCTSRPLQYPMKSDTALNRRKRRTRPVRTRSFYESDCKYFEPPCCGCPF